MAKIAILGTGAWGTALANVLLKNNNEVYMWGIDQKEISDLNEQKNTAYFGDKKLFRIPDVVSRNIGDISKKRPDLVVVAVPSIYIEDVLEKYISSSQNKPIVINVAKGFNPKTNDVWSKTIKNIIKKNSKGFVTLIGPSFSSEVFDDQPTVVNAISKSEKAAKIVAKAFDSKNFKCVPMKDEIGGEIVAALKNVMAIALGLAYQQHTSINTRAAMLAQATKEITVIMKKIGGRTRTIAQFCGIGDIYLTCTDEKSRNFTFGKLIGEKGMKVAMSENLKTVEGYYAAAIAKRVIDDHKINAPVLNSIYNILYMNESKNDFVANIIKEIIN